MNPLEKYINDEFDRGWDLWMAEIKKVNNVSNERLYRLLKVIKGEMFVKDLKRVLDVAGDGQRIQIIRWPLGSKMADRRWKSFPFIWIQQKSVAEGYEGTICLQIKDNRWLVINFFIPRK